MCKLKYPMANKTAIVNNSANNNAVQDYKPGF